MLVRRGSCQLLRCFGQWLTGPGVWSSPSRLPRDQSWVKALLRTTYDAGVVNSFLGDRGAGNLAGW